MAIHFAPMGSRGQKGMRHSHLEDHMEGTAIDLYMSFGLRTLPHFDNGAKKKESYIHQVHKILDEVIADSPIKLIVSLHKEALNDIREEIEADDYDGLPGPGFFKIDRISTEFDSHGKVWGYYIEEPNWANQNWSDDVVNAAKGHLTKPVIAMVRTAGGRDAGNPDDPDTMDKPANQQTFDDYAVASNQIAGFDYPHSRSQWSNIEVIADSGRPLRYLADNTPGKDFWFSVEVNDGSHRQTTEAEIKWMTHRALIEGAQGIFFFSFLRANEGGRQAIENVCQEIEDKVTNDAMDTAVLDNEAELVSGTDVVFAYRKHCGDYWLLVADKKPETPGTRNFTIKCNLGSDFNNLIFLREMYDAPSTSIPTTNPGNNYKKFDGVLDRGGVKLYRFFT